jgi:hypothetical protein
LYLQCWNENRPNSWWFIKNGTGNELLKKNCVTPLRTHTLRDDVHEISSGSSAKSCCILLKVLRGTEPILDLNDHIFTGHEPHIFDNLIKNYENRVLTCVYFFSMHVLCYYQYYDIYMYICSYRSELFSVTTDDLVIKKKKNIQNVR